MLSFDISNNVKYVYEAVEYTIKIIFQLHIFFYSDNKGLQDRCKTKTRTNLI